MVHKLKTVNPYFSAVWDLEKRFEVRKNDRNFKVGDLVLLHEYTEEKNYTGREIKVKILYILDNKEFVKRGFVVFSFSVESLNNWDANSVFFKDRIL